MTAPFRGTAGRRVRENDEGHASGQPAAPPRPFPARYPGRCAASGAPIAIGDLVAFSPGLGVVLVRAVRP